ncbi:molybdopterin dinucleotide binding domain-containing protein [Candidatus Poriferisodalis sp.]|uniref:molybdopterin dinucleotide binding domain-containing protein n=1 Tax=Candidatus Poriferisodalis sp. TaxID=3101277 RepID=UPI003B5935E1
MTDRQIHIRSCSLCEAMCGLEVHHADGDVKLIRTNHNDVWSKGYIGNAAGFNYSISRYAGMFLQLAGLPTVYSSATVDTWPKNVSCQLMYGHAWRIPVPDIDRTDFMVVQGANPAAGQGSFMARPGAPAALDEVRERGKVVVIDPRRSETCAHADQWLPVRPGTDALLQLSVVNVLFDEGLVRLGHLADRLKGVDKVRAIAAEFPPERVAEACGTDASTIRTLAREFAAAERAVWYARIGTCNQEFGTLASWLPDVICALTANLDAVGGLMWSKPVAWSMLQQDWGFESGFGRWSSRVRNAPEVLGQFPMGCLAEEIDTPGEGQIKALVVVGGNPVLSAPESTRLDTALPQLEAMISVDNALNETSRHADVVLPGLAALEQPFYSEMLWGWATRSAAKYAPPLFPSADGRPDEWEILTRLGAMCAGMGDVNAAEFDDLYFSALVELTGADPAVALAASPDPGPERINDLAVRTGPWGDRYGENPDGLSLDKLRDLPDGLDMGPMVPQVDNIVIHPDGKVDLAPERITADIERLAGRLDRPAGSLVLTSRRHVRSNNSWMHNVEVLVRGKDRCTLLIHPADAADAGVVDGEVARVSSSSGAVEVRVEVSDEMYPGVVSLPHGWGHDKPGTRQSVASRYAGVNYNVLVPPDFVDVPSGNAAVNGVPVSVVPV